MTSATVLALEGAAIEAGYVSGPTLYVGWPSVLRAHARITAGPASPIGQVVFKWQGTADESDPNGWEDLVSSRDDSGAVELEHTYAAPPGSRLSHSFTLDVRGCSAVRLLGRAVGGVGQVGDRVLVIAVPW